MPVCRLRIRRSISPRRFSRRWDRRRKRMNFARPRVAAAALAVATVLAATAADARFDPATEKVEPDVVARRFPDPDVTYDTPGFRPGRTDFTSHAELVAWGEALQR